MFWEFMSYMRALALYFGFVYLVYCVTVKMVKDYIDIDDENDDEIL